MSEKVMSVIDALIKASNFVIKKHFGNMEKEEMEPINIDTEEIKIKPIFPININRWWVDFTSKEIKEKKNLLFLADGKILRVKKIVFWVNAKDVTVDRYVLAVELFSNEDHFRITPCGINVYVFLKPFFKPLLADLFNTNSPPASYLLEMGLIWLLCYLWEKYQIPPGEILDSKKHKMSEFEEIVKNKSFYEVFGLDFKNNCVFCGNSSPIFIRKIFPFKIKDRDFTYMVCEKCGKIFNYLLDAA
jgi:hypothetical protein